MAEIVGLTPTNDGNGKSQQFTSTSSAAIAFQTATGGVEAPTDGGTGTFPSRYPTCLMMTALSANGWIRFGGSAVGTATSTTGGWDLFLPTGIPILYRRPIGSTHYRLIGDGTGQLQIGVIEGYYTNEAN